MEDTRTHSKPSCGGVRQLVTFMWEKRDKETNKVNMMVRKDVGQSWRLKI